MGQNVGVNFGVNSCSVVSSFVVFAIYDFVGNLILGGFRSRAGKEAKQKNPGHNWNFIDGDSSG